jgi:pheromone shutdown protein TraB
MISRRHFQENPSELHEILTFPGFQRVLLEEWDDVLEQMLLATHPISHPVAVVPANHTTTEIRLQGM